MKSERAFTLIECLVYIAVLAVVLNLSFGAYYRYDLYTRDLRRNADDIVRVMRAGERWRDDVRKATAPPHAIDNGVAIPQQTGEIDYVFADGAVWRQVAGARTVALKKVKVSAMSVDPREHVNAWRWELELTSPNKVVLVRPLFTFTAVAGEVTMKNERGSAMLVVLTFIILVTALVVANSFVLSGLRQELKRIDRDQQKRFQHASP